MNRPVNLFLSESSHYFGANSPVRNFERKVPEESSREELVLERTVPEPRNFMSRVLRKPAFCICENKDADQLRGNREADQRLCFRYIDSTIPLLSKSKFQASSHLLWLYSPVCVRPGRKPRRPVFSQRGSYYNTILAAENKDTVGLHVLK